MVHVLATSQPHCMFALYILETQHHLKQVAVGTDGLVQPIE